MTDMISMFTGTMRSARISRISEKQFADQVQLHSDEIREVLNICNIHGCYEPKFVRKELAEYLHNNFVYQVDLETMMKYIRKFRILKEDWPVKKGGHHNE